MAPRRKTGPKPGASRGLTAKEPETKPSSKPPMRTFYSIEDYDLHSFDLEMGTTPCGQLNYPKTVHQLVELALSTFQQKWPPTSIQIYRRIEQLQDEDILCIFEDPDFKKDFFSKINKNFRAVTSWGCHFLKAGATEDKTKDISGQIPLQLESLLDDYTVNELKLRARYVLHRQQGRELLREHILEGIDDNPSCPWECLKWTDYNSSLKPILPHHVAVFLFFSFLGSKEVPRLAWALELYHQADKTSARGFIGFLMTAADLNPSKLYGRYVDEPRSTCLPGNLMTLVHSVWDELFDKGIIATQPDGAILRTQQSVLPKCKTNTRVTFYTTEDVRDFHPAKSLISLKHVLPTQRDCEPRVEEIEAAANEKGETVVVSPFEITTTQSQCEEEFNRLHLNMANENRALFGLSPFTMKELEENLQGPSVVFFPSPGDKLFSTNSSSETDPSSIDLQPSAERHLPLVEPPSDRDNLDIGNTPASNDALVLGPSSRATDNRELELSKRDHELEKNHLSASGANGRVQEAEGEVHVLDTDGTAETPVPKKARRAAGIRKPRNSNAKVTIPSLDYMDGPSRVAHEDWVPFWGDIGPLSSSNLPPFFRKLRKEHIEELNTLSQSAKITKRELGFYWSHNFNKDGQVRNSDDSLLPSREDSAIAQWRTNLSTGLPAVLPETDKGDHDVQGQGDQEREEELQKLQAQLKDMSSVKERYHSELHAAQAQLQELTANFERCQAQLTDCETIVSQLQAEKSDLQGLIQELRKPLESPAPVYQGKCALEDRRKEFRLRIQQEKEIRRLEGEVKDIEQELLFERELCKELANNQVPKH